MFDSLRRFGSAVSFLLIAVSVGVRAGEGQTYLPTQTPQSEAYPASSQYQAASQYQTAPAGQARRPRATGTYDPMRTSADGPAAVAPRSAGFAPYGSSPAAAPQTPQTWQTGRSAPVTNPATPYAQRPNPSYSHTQRANASYPQAQRPTLPYSQAQRPNPSYPPSRQQRFVPRGAGPSSEPVRSTALPAARPPADVAAKPSGDESPDKKSGDEAEADQLSEKIAAATKEVEQSESLGEEEKKAQLEILAKATKWIQNAKEYESKAVQYETEAKEAPQNLEEAKAALVQPLRDPVPEYAPDATLAQLEKGLNEAEEQLRTAQEEFAEHEKNADSKARADRKAEIAEQKEAAKKKLREAEDETKAAASEDGEASSGVRRLELEARLRAIKGQVTLLDAERARLDALAELFPVKRDASQRGVAWSEKLVEAWREVVSDYRKAESERQAAEARRIASEAHPAVRDLAERNAELAESRTTLAKNMEEVAGYLEAAKKKAEELTADFKAVKDKVEVAGMTPTVGLLLRDRRDRLPDVKEHERRIAFSSSEMQKAQVALMELENERSQMGDLDERIEQAIAELGQVSSQFQPGYLENMVRGLLQDRREYFDGLLGDYRTYHEDLNELDLTTRELLKQTAAYRAFIDEHVLWISSASPIGLSDVKESWKALLSMLQPGQWSNVAASTLGNVTEHPLASTVLVLACIALFVFRRRIVVRLEALGKRVDAEGETSFMPTLQALGLTVALATVWPLLLWGIGWWLSLSAAAPDLAIGLARGLRAIAAVMFVAEMFRQVCRPGGLAQCHFHWQTAWVDALHRSVNSLMLLGLPILFLVSLTETFDGGAWQDSLGRLATLAGLLALTAFLHEVLHPWKGAMQAAFARMSTSWPAKLRYVWYVLGVGIPVSLGVLVGIGYIYSANQIMVRLQSLIGLVLGLVLAQALLLRAMKVARARVLAFRSSMEVTRRRMLGESEESATAEDEMPLPDVQHVDRQLGQLVRGVAVLSFAVATWFIMADMFPAFQVLDRIEFWSTTQMVSEQITAADGSVTMETVPKKVPVTLADMLLVGVVIVATVVTTRTVPGLLEIAILGRLPIDAGVRHAVVIISRYTVTLIGAIIACRMLGMTWSSVQWLAAAMSVGLGFGLQEIFANLVSGLIILFERPIRIGDLVTVGGTTGKITRMQIRATTITDFDRREMIVPNKKFITDDVVNWTLSDPVSRFVVPVGISYDSDPSQARDLLLRIAKEHPLVLDEPEPSTVFCGFGDSTLDLELRAFLATRDHFVTVLNEINTAIERRFREANIEIAFPQQDIHIRGISGLDEIANRDNEHDTTRKAA